MTTTSVTTAPRRTALRLSPALLDRIQRLSGCRGRWIVDCRALDGGYSYSQRTLTDAAFWPMPDGSRWAVSRPEPAPYRFDTPEDAALYCAATGWQSKLLWLTELLDDDDRWPGGYSAPSIVVSNARVFRDEYVKELAAGADGDADGLSLDIRYVTQEMLETLESLESYPLLSEDDHSELELELQDEEWRLWAAKEWRDHVVKALESLAPEDAADAEQWAEDTADAVGDDTLESLFSGCAEAANEYWEEQCCGMCSEGFYIDLRRCAQELETLLPQALESVAPVAYDVAQPVPELPASAPDAPLITVALGAHREAVPAVWVGANLAVHRTYGAESPVAWTVTHIASGFKVATFSSALGETAVTLARQWDEPFEAVTADNANTWELRDAFKAARVAAGANAF